MKTFTHDDRVERIRYIGKLEQRIMRYPIIYNIKVIRRLIMWDRWKDVWMSLLLGVAIALSTFIIYVILWNTIYPTKLLGYHVTQQSVGGSKEGKIIFYTVEAIREHASNRTIYTTTNFDDATRVLILLQSSGEVE